MARKVLPPNKASGYFNEDSPFQMIINITPAIIYDAMYNCQHSGSEN
jgi:hypothetical protein